MFQKILTSSLLALIAIGGFFVSVDVNNNSSDTIVELGTTIHASDVQLTNQYGSQDLKNADGRF